MGKFQFIVSINKRIMSVSVIEADSMVEAIAESKKIRQKEIPFNRLKKIQDKYDYMVIDEIQIPPAIEEELLKIERCILRCVFYKLTVMEMNVVMQLRLCITRKEIAINLAMSGETVRTHFVNIFSKLQVFTDRLVEKALCE